MTPEEIVADLNARNRAALHACEACGGLNAEQILALMDEAAMHGFKLGSNVALSMIKGSLLIQLNRTASMRSGRTGA